MVKLPLLENPVSFVPFVELSALGSTLDRSSFTGAQLAVIFDGPHHPDRVQGSFYNLGGVLESDFFLDFPFSTRGNRYCLANILGAMGVLQLFYSDAPGPGGYLSLAADGTLNVHCEQRRYGAVERILIKAFRALGFWSFPFLVRYGEPGGSFHYAGTLPMSHCETMKGLATDPMGRLQRTRMVFAIDASTFPLLPAKNLSLTIMANAMRIAAQVSI
jgi:choline dehydrogenase-like flavoprotein